MVVKTGPGVHVTEANTMKFIRGHTMIPMPKVIDTYERNGYQHIVMEFVRGKLLKDL